MDGNSSSDDEDLNRIQNSIDYRASKKRKEVPPASIPELLETEHIQNSASLEIQDSVPQPGGSGRRNRDNVQNLNFPWLELVGPTCHSVKQTKSGADLSQTKKKYRNMRCLICAQHNPSTPWAELWPRKFELQTLVDHAKSGAHVKSEAALRSLPDYTPLTMAEQNPPIFKIVAGSGKALQLDKQARDEASELAHPPASLYGDMGGDDEMGIKSNVRIRGVMNPAGTHVIAHSTRIRPDWLYSEGNLCLSDKQLADPTLHPGTKKKYKQMACLYCREYVPDSMWANLRPRKFESAVIADHERSAVHQKAVELRMNHLNGGEDLNEAVQLEAMRTAQELLRGGDGSKFAEY